MLDKSVESQKSTQDLDASYEFKNLLITVCISDWHILLKQIWIAIAGHGICQLSQAIVANTADPTGPDRNHSGIKGVDSFIYFHNALYNVYPKSCEQINFLNGSFSPWTCRSLQPVRNRSSLYIARIHRGFRTTTGIVNTCRSGRLPPISASH